MSLSKWKHIEEDSCAHATKLFSGCGACCKVVPSTLQNSAVVNGFSCKVSMNAFVYLIVTLASRKILQIHLVSVQFHSHTVLHHPPRGVPASSHPATLHFTPLETRPIPIEDTLPYIIVKIYHLFRL